MLFDNFFSHVIRRRTIITEPQYGENPNIRLFIERNGLRMRLFSIQGEQENYILLVEYE